MNHLQEFEIPVRTLGMNNVFGDTGDCWRCQAKRETHEEKVEKIWKMFPNLQIWEVTHIHGEVTGLDSPKEIGTHYHQQPSN